MSNDESVSKMKGKEERVIPEEFIEPQQSATGTLRPRDPGSGRMVLGVSRTMEESIRILTPKGASPPNVDLPYEAGADQSSA